MIIICEKCSTKFNVPDSAIGVNGRTVKCSSCAHSWHVGGTAPVAPTPKPLETPAVTAVAPTPTNTETTPEAKFNLEEMKASPRRYIAPSAPVYQKSFVYYGSMLAACCAFFCFLAMAIVFHRTSIVHKIPALQSAFDLVGLYNNEGLKLELVDCTLSELQSSNSANGAIEIEVAVSVLNTSEQDRKLGRIRFSVYNIERDYVGELVMPLDLVLAPNKNTKVEGRLNRVPKDSFYVAIDFGNNLDLKILNPERMHKIG